MVKFYCRLKTLQTSLRFYISKGDEGMKLISFCILNKVWSIYMILNNMKKMKCVKLCPQMYPWFNQDKNRINVYSRWPQSIVNTFKFYHNYIIAGWCWLFIFILRDYQTQRTKLKFSRCSTTLIYWQEAWRQDLSAMESSSHG